MARRSVVRALVLTVLTLALASSLAAMFLVQGGFDEAWLYGSLALYGTALLAYWLIGAGTSAPTRASRDDVAEKVAAALALTARQGRSELSEPEPELVVEPSRSEPIVFPSPLAPAPSTFQYRGYTLYERGGSRFFSKGVPPGAKTVLLPSGYEAVWDEKKEKPVLVEIGAAPEEPETAVAAAKKACSAMVAPGEFCENLAKDGSKYCPRHVDYRGAEELFEVRTPGTIGPGKATRTAAPDIEVRLAKPVARPLNVRRGPSPTIEVRLAKPSNTKEIRLQRGKPVEVKADKRGAKPLKLRPPGRVEVELDRRDASKPVRLGKAIEPIVKLAKPTAGKPVKVKPAADPTVRLAKPSEPKPLRFKDSGPFSVREVRATPRSATGKRLAASEVIVKTPRLLESQTAKGKQLPASEIVIKKPSNPATPKGKQLQASDLVIKKPTTQAAPKGKNLAPSEVVVKRPGVAKPAPPLALREPEIIVKRPAAARREPIRATKDDDVAIVVVKDTKRRTMLGVSGDAPKK